MEYYLGRGESGRKINVCFTLALLSDLVAKRTMQCCIHSVITSSDTGTQTEAQGVQCMGTISDHTLKYVGWIIIKVSFFGDTQKTLFTNLSKFTVFRCCLSCHLSPF